MSRTYDYDPIGNITSILDAIEPSGNEVLEDAGTYTYQQATNRLTQVQGELNVVYGYDANGNITSANNRTFVYDLSNRLIRVEDNGITIAEYVYNASNQRIKKVAQGVTRIFHYDLQGHIIGETDQTGQMVAEYIYLGDQPLVLIRPGEVAYYYHNDHLGTPQILTDDSGTVSWKATYTPFGETVISIGTVENPFRFPGQYYDQETGLHYNWNRYYDPQTGRYLTPDPIGLEGEINLFAYVQNNPINLVDSRGLKVELCTRSRGYYHTFIVVDGVGAGFYPTSGNVWLTEGIVLPDSKQPGDSCGEIGPPCEKKEQFEACIKDEILKAIKTPPSYSLLFRHCYTWATRIINKCYRRALLGF
jgi:RHS repeat-associated protein